MTEREKPEEDGTGIGEADLPNREPTLADHGGFKGKENVEDSPEREREDRPEDS